MPSTADPATPPARQAMQRSDSIAPVEVIKI
jgi:hypothetical protein